VFRDEVPDVSRQSEVYMFARIGTWEGTTEELEKWIVRGREQVKPDIAKDPGLKAVYRAPLSAVLPDRALVS
jgi:hypothetical protein